MSHINSESCLLFLHTSISLTLRCCNTDSAICSLLLQFEPQGRRPTPNWFFGTSLGSEPVALWDACTSWHNHSFFKVRHLQRTTTLIHIKPRRQVRNTFATEENTFFRTQLHHGVLEILPFSHTFLAMGTAQDDISLDTDAYSLAIFYNSNIL